MNKDKNRVSIDDMEEDFSKEIPGVVKAKSMIDEWLTGNVVEPMANAGYPNLGAGIATVPSTIAEFLIPTTPGEFAPGMAGVGKLSRKAKFAAKDVANKLRENPNLLEIFLKDVREKWKDWEHKNSGIVTSGSDNPHFVILNYLKNLKNKIVNSTPMSANDKIGQFKSDKNLAPGEYFKKYFNDEDFKKINFPAGKKDKSEIYNSIINKDSSKLIDFWDRNFNKSNKEYLRPKGYANQKSTKLPKQKIKQEIMREQPSRADYDKMLGGTNPGQTYFDEMSEEYRKFIQGEQEPDFFRDYIKNSWKGK